MSNPEAERRAAPVGMGTIEQAFTVLAALMRGQVFERNSLADAFDITVASADRYIKHLGNVPGVLTTKKGRRLFVAFSFGHALREVGR